MIVTNTAYGTHRLPLRKLNASALKQLFGSRMSLTSEIDLHIEMSVEAQPNHIISPVELVAPIIDFRIAAVLGEQELEIKAFHSYVERLIALPEGIDANKITTGVIFLKDGSMRPVPTKLLSIGKRYFAIINSIYNSQYSVVYNEQTFTDIQGHWAQESIEDMASRLIVNGINDHSYLPNQAVTRADFALTLVRAMGLYHYAPRVSFADADSYSSYDDAISIAANYGLMNGFPDGHFNHELKMTRQEAMVSIARAVSFTGRDSSKAEQLSDDEFLSTWLDGEEVAQWARPAVCAVLRYRIFQGEHGRLRPAECLTRAELAVIIQRMLQYVDFI